MVVEKCSYKNEKLRNSQGLLQFVNCKLLRGHQLIDQDLWVENGIVVNPEPIFFHEKRQPVVQIDCGKCILAPGFIDIQINGDSKRVNSENYSCIKKMTVVISFQADLA